MLTKERLNEIGNQLLKDAQSRPSGSKRVEFDLARGEMPNKSNLKELAETLYPHVGGYWLQTFRVSHIRTDKGREYIELLIKHRNPPDDPYPV